MNNVRERTDIAQTKMPDMTKDSQALTASAPQRLTVPQERELSRKNMLAQVESNKADIQKFLKSFDIEYDFFFGGLRVFLMRQMQTQPDFFTKVTLASFMEALFRCAKDGLVPDGKEAAIGHFSGVATYLPMRSGFVKVLWRTGMIKDINDNTVSRQEYEQGRFEWQDGDGGFIRHQPSLERTDDDEIVAAYCVINLVSGGTIREVVTKPDLVKIRKMSKSPARAQWGTQMDRKAAIRRIMGKMPQEKAIAQLLTHDEDAYDPTLIDQAPKESAIPKAALFSNRAHVRAKPVGEPEEGAVDAEIDELPPMSPQPGVRRIVASLERCEDLPTLIDLQEEAGYLECDQDEIDLLTETFEATRMRLMPTAAEIEGESDDVTSEENSAPFTLQAITSSTTGLKGYEDVKLWAADLLNKMNSVKGDSLTAFWSKNLPHILAAKANGYAEDAERVLKVASAKNLSVE